MANSQDFAESSVLVTPTSKKNSYFPRSYPFPIIKDDGNSAFNCIIGHLKDQCVEITDEENIKILFTMGFFGKGTLSRSTPHALDESLRKDAEGNKKKRGYWRRKKKRAAQQNKSEPDRIDVVFEDDEEENPAKRRKNDEIEVVLSDSNTNDESESDHSASEDIVQSKSTEKEALQLTFEEAFFLSYGLGCLVVKDKDQPLGLMRLWHRFSELHPTQNFPVMYTAYHHFRAKGWVVRNGLKYGTDFVLYKDGPPFYHSTYAVIVKALKEKNLRDVIGPAGRPCLNWAALAGLNRICTHAAKALMILYVIKPGTISENKISTPFCVAQYKLEEVIVKRWVPSENRTED